ncbi:hypothetical protein C2E23DRAFT_54196 [Lenzites betulinus]|nr:hypothetical protein C2E23DRAFT_54196 [Lenzites betulinus]
MFWPLEMSTCSSNDIPSSLSSPAPSPPPSSASSSTNGSISTNHCDHCVTADTAGQASSPFATLGSQRPFKSPRNNRRRGGGVSYPAVGNPRGRRTNTGRNQQPSHHGPDTTRTRKTDASDATRDPITRPRAHRPDIDVACSKLWSDELNTRKIRNNPEENTEWYESHGETMLSSPPAGVQELPFDPREQPFPIGRLHVHTQQLPESPERTVQAWMWARDKAGPHRRERSGAGTQWIAVEPGDMHPRLPGYVLHYTPAGKPSWIREASAQSYEPKDKMEARIARMARRG